VARSERLAYHVEALGLVFQDIHDGRGKWRIRLFLSFVVESVPRPCLVGEGDRGASGRSRFSQASRSPPSRKRAAGDRAASQAPFHPIKKRGAVKLLRRRPASALARH
jgi:hypothetical protein